MTVPPNEVTGANGPPQLPIRTRWAARVAQLDRYARRASTRTRGSGVRISNVTPSRLPDLRFWEQCREHILAVWFGSKLKKMQAGRTPETDGFVAKENCSFDVLT
jgi:hypothetical protein